MVARHDEFVHLVDYEQASGRDHASKRGAAEPDAGGRAQVPAALASM